MRRAVLVLTLALGVVWIPSPARAGEPQVATSTTSTSSLPSSEGGIIPKPNGGVAPTDSGDRGGAAQIALFFIMLGAVSLIGFLAYRSSVKARRTNP